MSKYTAMLPFMHQLGAYCHVQILSSVTGLPQYTEAPGGTWLGALEG